MLGEPRGDRAEAENDRDSQNKTMHQRVDRRNMALQYSNLAEVNKSGSRREVGEPDPSRERPSIISPDLGRARTAGRVMKAVVVCLFVGALVAVTAAWVLLVFYGAAWLAKL